MNDARLPGDPEPGSHPYFALLYAPADRRRTLSIVLALGREIGSDPAIGADHSVAHARLSWWRREAERFAQGAPEHPWLRTLLDESARARNLDLRALVDGAEMDLATRTLSGGERDALPGALFITAAHVLIDGTLDAPLQGALADLGSAVRLLERNCTDAAARSAADATLAVIGAVRQSPLAPLLVWLALAAAAPRGGGRVRHTLSSNFIAWSAARRAARGRFNLS